MDVLIPKLDSVNIRIDDRAKAVVLVSSRGTAMRIPYKAVPILCRAMITQAKKIEEIENVHQVIKDGALLFRAGAPFGLTDNPEIKKSIAHEAQYDDDLRRQLPGGVKSKAMFGTPTIIRHAPKREGTDANNQGK